MTPWTAACQASLSFISQSLLKLMSVELVMPSNHLILGCPLLLPTIFPSIGIFPSELSLPIRWPKGWSFSFSPSSEYAGLISFRMDWLDLLAVQGTLKSLLQYQNSKASILQHSAFFMVQLLHPYMTASFLSSCNFKETHSKRGRRGMEKLTGKNFLSKGVLKIKYHVTTLKTTLWEQSKAG